jgi:hypothetical protein
MKQQKTRLTYSDTHGIIEEGPAPEALIVCIIQVVDNRWNDDPVAAEQASGQPLGNRDDLSVSLGMG